MMGLIDIVDAYLGQKDFTDSFLPWLDDETRKLKLPDYRKLGEAILVAVSEKATLNGIQTPTSRKEFNGYLLQLEEQVAQDLLRRKGYRKGDLVMTPDGEGYYMSACAEHLHVTLKSQMGDRTYAEKEIRALEERPADLNKARERAHKMVETSRTAAEKKYKPGNADKDIGALIAQAVARGKDFVAPYEVAKLLVARLPDYVAEIAAIAGVQESALANVPARSVTSTAQEVLEELLEQERGESSGDGKPTLTSNDARYYRTGDVVETNSGARGTVEAVLAMSEIVRVKREFMTEDYYPWDLKLVTPVFKPGDYIEVIGGNYDITKLGSWGVVRDVLDRRLAVDFKFVTEKSDRPHAWQVYPEDVVRLAPKEALE